VYRGPFNDLLVDLEKDAYWRKSKGGDEPEGRFKEREVHSFRRDLESES